jgi:hypothetical protein
MAVVTVDGRNVGFVGTRRQWEHAAVPASLTAGPHEITVRFINDMNRPPEDRNLYLKAVRVGPVPPDFPNIVRVASGASVAAVPIGKGRVVINFLRWDRQERNARKAQRFFASLLTAIGADFIPLVGTSYDLRTFAPQPSLANHRIDGKHTYMGSTGWIQGEIDVPQADDYRLILEAAGTKAVGEYPEIEVFVDGQRTAAFHLTAERWRNYTIRLRLSAGKHKLRLRFTNDYYDPPEDRNLRLGRLLIAPVE